MLVVLVTQKTDALLVIVVSGTLITLFQLYNAYGGWAQWRKQREAAVEETAVSHTSIARAHDSGIARAHDEARQRGIAHAVEDLLTSGRLTKFNVAPHRIRTLVCHLYGLDPQLFVHDDDHHHHERIPEPNLDLEAAYQEAYGQIDQIARRIEDYSHIGIFTFIHNYHLNWVDPAHNRTAATVQQAMLDILFPLTEHDEIWQEYCAYQPETLPEPIWQFSRQRYIWAKDQWPNLSDRITTIWVLQDFGLIPDDIDVQMVISVANGRQFRTVSIPAKG